MSVEDPSTRPPRTTHPRLDASDRSAADPPSSNTPDSDPLAHRIERARLRARVDRLERDLAASESQRQAIVGQYELALEERNCSTDCADEPAGGLVDAVRRFLRQSR